jgi:hypothetical protein
MLPLFLRIYKSIDDEPLDNEDRRGTAKGFSH